MRFTQALKTVMKEKGVTGVHIAKQLGVSQQSMSFLFKQKDIGLAKLNAIMGELGYKVVVMPSSTPTPEGGYKVE